MYRIVNHLIFKVSIGLLTFKLRAFNSNKQSFIVLLVRQLENASWYLSVSSTFYLIQRIECEVPYNRPIGFQQRKIRKSTMSFTSKILLTCRSEHSRSIATLSNSHWFLGDRENVECNLSRKMVKWFTCVSLFVHHAQLVQGDERHNEKRVHQEGQQVQKTSWWKHKRLKQIDCSP